MEGFREIAWLAELGCDGHIKHSPGPRRSGCAAVVWLDCRWELQGVLRIPVSHASTGCGVLPLCSISLQVEGTKSPHLCPNKTHAVTEVWCRCRVSAHTHTHAMAPTRACPAPTARRLARTRSFQLLWEESRESRGRDDQDEGGSAGELCMTPGGERYLHGQRPVPAARRRCTCAFLRPRFISTPSL